MARICAVLCASHSPWLFAPAQGWDAARAQRAARGAISPDTPVETTEQNEHKYARVQEAYATLRGVLERAEPDVILVFGDDQLEQFSFKNFPAFALFTGDAYSGYRISRHVGLPLGAPRPVLEKTPEHWATVRSDARFSKALLRDLVRAGFDLAFSNELADQDEGMGHAFMRPFHYLDPEFRTPVVPFYVNCYYGPQPTGVRCYELGRAVRAAIERMPDDLNVAVLGSGGLWHLPNEPQAWLDEDFDACILDGIRSGDALATARYFDGVTPAFDPNDDVSVMRASGGTGVVLGWGSGTGETRSWLAASAVADGKPGTVVDYVPIYASPIGTAFAYWESV